MLAAFLRDRAILYVCGSLEGSDRDQFELVLEFHEELRNFVNELEEVETALLLGDQSPAEQEPAPGLRKRVRDLIDCCPRQSAVEGLVVSDPHGRVRWINPAFTDLCGYTLEEVRGKKLGPILQGKDTDAHAAGRLREAVHGYKACREKLLNYHKDGSSYWVEISLTPIFDDQRRPRYLIAQEKGVSGPARGETSR